MLNKAANPELGIKPDMTELGREARLTLCKGRHFIRLITDGPW
jgi:hypothetical protein